MTRRARRKVPKLTENSGGNSSSSDAWGRQWCFVGMVGDGWGDGGLIQMSGWWRGWVHPLYYCIYLRRRRLSIDLSTTRASSDDVLALSQIFILYFLTFRTAANVCRTHKFFSDHILIMTTNGVFRRRVSSSSSRSPQSVRNVANAPCRADFTNGFSGLQIVVAPPFRRVTAHHGWSNRPLFTFLNHEHSHPQQSNHRRRPTKFCCVYLRHLDIFVGIAVFSTQNLFICKSVKRPRTI